MKISKLKVQMIMARKGISFSELADRMGKSPSAVSGMFTRSVRTTTATKICEVLECDIKDIVLG